VGAGDSGDGKVAGGVSFPNKFASIPALAAGAPFGVRGWKVSATGAAVRGTGGFAAAVGRTVGTGLAGAGKGVAVRATTGTGRAGAGPDDGVVEAPGGLAADAGLGVLSEPALPRSNGAAEVPFLESIVPISRSFAFALIVVRLSRSVHIHRCV